MKVLLLAYLDNNFGDDMMIELLCQKFPNIQFTTITSNSIIVDSFKHLDNLKVVVGDVTSLSIKEYDGLIKIGGSMFIASALSQYFHRFNEIIFLKKAKRMGLWCISLGSNYGPYTKIGKFLVKKELKLYNILTVRDTKSLNFYISNIKKNNISKFDDIVFSFNINKDLKKNKEYRMLGITPYRSSNRKINSQVYQGLALISDNYIQSTGGSIRLFSFDTENENDLAACYQVRRFSKYPEKIEIIPYLGERISFLESIGECTEFLAIRFHGAVVAESLGVPYYPIAYSNKMKNFIIDSFQKKNYLDIEKLIENISYVANNLINNENLLTSVDRNSDGHFQVLHKFFNENQKIK